MRNVETNRAEKTVKKFSISAVALVLVSVMIFGCAIGGTLAWLTTLSKETVKNVFVLGDIKLNLSQNNGNELEFRHADFLPGSNPVEVDPVVTVGLDSVKCYVFIAISYTDNFSKVADYKVDTNEGWIPLNTPVFETTDDDGNTLKNVVYYTIFDPAVFNMPKDYHVIKDGKIAPKTNFDSGVSYDDGDTLLNFMAFACQYSGVTESDGEPTDEDINRAWSEVYNAHLASKVENPKN